MYTNNILEWSNPHWPWFIVGFAAGLLLALFLRRS